jgi:molecular chaperone GrpE
MPGDEASTNGSGDSGTEPSVQPDRAACPPTVRVEQLEARIEELETIVEERTSALARVQNDYKQYRKRADREKEQARQQAQGRIVSVLADVLDDVDRALSANPSENVQKGLGMLVRRIEDEMDGLGASRVQPDPGAVFDPERHEALITEATDEHEPDTVIEVLQPGYELEETLVRAARVKVAEEP